MHLRSNANRITLVLLLSMFGNGWASTPNRIHRLSLEELHDKIAGGWAGKMIGVSFAAPTEFRAQGRIMEGPLPPWKPEHVSNSLKQDDLYVNMTLAKVLDEKGWKATTADFGNLFRDAQYGLWHANLAARRALRRGVPAALSGTPKYNAHANDIDFQIEADFIGLTAPGLYQSANRIADHAGRVMNYGDGLYGGMFVAGMYSAAFIETDIRRVVETGLSCIPKNSPYARLISDVLMWSKQYPDDWKKVWGMIGEKWDQREPCPAGALKPFNIDAKLNGAYIVLGLLYGEADFSRTMEIAVRSGQDSDCNGSTAAGILGVLFGYQAIPAEWKNGIPKIADSVFSYTDFTFNTMVESNMNRALALVRKCGGLTEGADLLIPVQKSKAPVLEIWDDYGSPIESISTDDRRWSWNGEWKASQNPSRGSSMTASEKNAEAIIEFEGTGVIVVGPYLPEGGKANIYLDGRLHKTVDVCSDERQTKNDEAVWHAFHLKPKRHQLKIVVCGEPYGSANKTEVAISRLTVFR